jgi:hypothetical protein
MLTKSCDGGFSPIVGVEISLTKQHDHRFSLPCGYSVALSLLADNRTTPPCVLMSVNISPMELDAGFQVWKFGCDQPSIPIDSKRKYEAAIDLTSTTAR